MKAYLTDYNKNVFLLPVLLSWDVRHGMGLPCDSFEVSFLYEETMISMLSDAVRFRAEHEGETVFYGVVDEYEISSGGEGLVAVVRGRGMAALLLDNEAEAAEYYGVNLGFILQRHVYPYGIDEVRTGSFSPVSMFTVASGESQWRVLEDFAWFCGGVRPYFSRDGALVLSGEGGDRRSISKKTALSSVTYRDKRYGVISEVLVKNRVCGTNSKVTNDDLIARGGRCRRVINVPSTTGWNAMRYTGEYQIMQSKLEEIVCEISMAELFSAFPGDIIALDGVLPGVDGEFLVSETRCWANGESFGTVLTLTKE